MDKETKLIDWDENEKRDRNRNGIDDELEPPAPDIAAGARELAERFRENPNSSPELSGGDVDARWEMADSSGDEAVGGSMPTPDQSVVEEIGAAIGVTYADNEELKIGEKERSRDKHRWELDPASSEDYVERTRKDD